MEGYIPDCIKRASLAIYAIGNSTAYSSLRSGASESRKRAPLVFLICVFQKLDETQQFLAGVFIQILDIVHNVV